MRFRSTALITLSLAIVCIAAIPASAQVTFAQPFGLSNRFMPHNPLGRVAPRSLGYSPMFWYFENGYSTVVPSYDAAQSINAALFGGPINAIDQEDDQAQVQPPADKQNDPAAKKEPAGKVGDGVITSKISDQDALRPENAIPRTSESIESKLQGDGQVVIKWSGAAELVSHVTMAILDREKKVLKSQTFTRLPVEGKYALTNKTAFYQVVVRYVNGTTTSVISPL